jgi:hypothetical protein
MAKPARRKGSSRFQFRRQTPRDLWRRRNELSAIGITIAKEVGASLPTRESPARERETDDEEEAVHGHAEREDACADGDLNHGCARHEESRA